MKELTALLSLKLETLQLSSYWKSTPFPPVRIGLHPPMVQSLPEAGQIHNINCASPFQVILREAASRGEDVQEFKMFP